MLLAASDGSTTPAGPPSKRWGFIDSTGALVLAAKFERFEGGFREGLAAVAEPGRDFGYIDPHGKYVVLPRFTVAREFVSGIARVQQRSATDGRSEFGYINRSGDFVWGPFPIP